MSDIDMRILYLEKEIELLNNQLNDLRDKLSINPFTRDSFRPSVSLDFVWNGPIPAINKEAKE